MELHPDERPENISAMRAALSQGRIARRPLATELPEFRWPASLSAPTERALAAAALLLFLVAAISSFG